VVFQPLQEPHWLSKEARASSGAYYTPTGAATVLGRFGASLDVRSVLDPSVGGGSLLHAFEREARALDREPAAIFGVDVDAGAIRELQDRPWRLQRADFLALNPGVDHPLVDLVLMNPPYVRHQRLGDRRTSSANILAAVGLELPGTASLWLAHLAHAVAFVNPGGALAAIVPADLLDSQSGRTLLDHVARSFASVEVQRFKERLFPKLSVETVILLAQGRGQGPCLQVKVRADASVAAVGDSESDTGDTVPSPREQSEALIAELSRRKGWRTLGELADISLGLVTGANDFFLLTDAQAQALPGRALRPILGSTADARSSSFTIDDHLSLLRNGRPAYLFAPLGDPEKQSEAERQLIAAGERRHVDQGYKCKNRTPWYIVPGADLKAPALLLTYVNDRAPRLIENKAGSLATNAFHWVKPKQGISAAGLAVAFRNPVTLLSAELQGKAMGGGALRLDIGPARKIVLPWPHTNVELLPAAGREVGRRERVEAERLLQTLRTTRRGRGA
jgi:adenine-specific DNA-methyltransferase